MQAENITVGSLVTIPGFCNQTHVVFYRNGTKVGTARWISRHNSWLSSGLWHENEVRLANPAERESFGLAVFETLNDRTPTLPQLPLENCDVKLSIPNRPIP